MWYLKSKQETQKRQKYLSLWHNLQRGKDVNFLTSLTYFHSLVKGQNRGKQVIFQFTDLRISEIQTMFLHNVPIR